MKENKGIIIGKYKLEGQDKRISVLRFRFAVQWHTKLLGLFKAKSFLLEGQPWYYLTHSLEDKMIHTFPQSICPKVNTIARLEFELAYDDSAVQHFNPYTTRTPNLKVLRM